MKRILLAFACILIISCGPTKLKILEPVSSGFEIDKSKNELYVSANNWMIKTFVDSKSVIEFRDKEEGIVTGKYNLKAPYKDPTQKALTIIKIQVKDQAAKITIDPEPFVEITDPWGGPSIIWGEKQVKQQINDLIADFENYIKNDQSQDW